MATNLPYATTKVPVEKSRMEIEILIKKYKGGEFEYRESAGNIFMFAFLMGGLKYRFILEAPPSDAMRRWRVLYWLIKADLEAIASKVVRIEERWFPNIVDPVTDQTMWELISPQLPGFRQQLQLTAKGSS